MKRTIAERVHEYLAEAHDAQFQKNKWRFWWPTVAGFAVINALLTAAIFRDGDSLQNYMGALMVAVAGLVCWLSVCALHYSDSPDKKLARGVAGLDSIALVFVVLHFAVCMYVFGHLHVLRAAEKKYEQEAQRFNAEARQLQADNVEIARSAAEVAREQTRRARLENDTMYQARKAAERGARISAPRSTSAPGAAPALPAGQVQLAAPTKPERSSAEFLADWDVAIRALNFGELLLSVLALILIRNRSARTNAPTSAMFIPFASTSSRTPALAAPFDRTKKKETRRTNGSFDSEGMKQLKAALRDISFRLHGRSFKSAVRGDAVFIYLVRANAGTQEVTHSAKAKLSLLTDARTMERDAFRERLERFLVQNGFEI